MTGNRGHASEQRLLLAFYPLNGGGAQQMKTGRIDRWPRQKRIEIRTHQGTSKDTSI
jgi:hypothetical protein